MARLFHVPLSPFCRKVRLSLAEKKIEVELVEERYWELIQISCAAIQQLRCQCCAWMAL